MNNSKFNNDHYWKGWADACKKYDNNQEIERLLSSIETLLKQIKYKIEKKGYEQYTLFQKEKEA